jgi:AraC family transcriptional activator of pobA
MNHPCYSLDKYFSEGKPCLSFNIEDLHHKAPYDETSMHRHDYYEIYLFGKAGGKHLIEFDYHDIQKESVSVLFPRQFHQLDVSKDAEGLVIMFNEELFCSEILRKELRAYFMDLQTKLNNIQLDSDQYAEIAMIANMIKELFKDLNIIRKEEVRHLISSAEM